MLLFFSYAFSILIIGNIIYKFEFVELVNYYSFDLGGMLMDKQKINSIKEMFRWKLNKKQCTKHKIESINYKSVEAENEDIIKKLNWGRDVDVLYSFLLVYKLGLEIVNPKRFEELKEETKKKLKINRLNTNSTEFLYLCSCDKAYEEFNSNTLNIEFLNLYFTIGNVIPIWPGGNEARGKMGVYDIPELFFNTYPKWTQELIRQYNNISIDSVVKNDMFLVCRENETKGYTIKVYKDLFNSIGELKNIMQNNKQVYFDYLLHRNNIITKRNLVLKNSINEG